MLTTKELTDIQSDAVLAMPDTVTIQKPTEADDGLGGRSETWSTDSTTVARISPSGMARGQMNIEAGSIRALSPWVITVPVDTAVEVGWRIVWGTREFGVKEVVSRSYQSSIRVYAEERA